MPLNDFGITIQLFFHAVECLRHKHSTCMVMALNVFGITIQLGRLLTVFGITIQLMPLNVFGLNI
jgi:hypothetical protein